MTSAPRIVRRLGIVLAGAAGGWGTAFAQPAASGTAHLPEVQVQGPRDAAIGSADSASEGAAEKASFQSRPKLRPG